MVDRLYIMPCGRLGRLLALLRRLDKSELASENVVTRPRRKLATLSAAPPSVHARSWCVCKKGVRPEVGVRKFGDRLPRWTPYHDCHLSHLSLQIHSTFCIRKQNSMCSPGYMAKKSSGKLLRCKGALAEKDKMPTTRLLHARTCCESPCS